MNHRIVGNETNSHALKLCPFLLPSQPGHHVAWIGVNFLALSFTQLTNTLEVLVRDHCFTADLDFTVVTLQFFRNALEIHGVLSDVVTNIAIATCGSVFQLLFIVQQADCEAIMLEFHLRKGSVTQTEAPIGQLFLVIDVTEAEHRRQVLDFLKATIGRGTNQVKRRQRVVSFPFKLAQLSFEGVIDFIIDV
ncbi:hypothetical protein D3C77_547090 [compost metagenome]